MRENFLTERAGKLEQEVEDTPSLAMLCGCGTVSLCLKFLSSASRSLWKDRNWHHQKAPGGNPGLAPQGPESPAGLPSCCLQGSLLPRDTEPGKGGECLS